MDGNEFVEQIQDVEQRLAELQQTTEQLPTQQKGRLTESLERLTAALKDLQAAEEAIRLLLSAVQQSRDSIIITTAKLDPPGPEIVYVNPAFSEMTGYSSEEVLGKTPRLLQGPETDRQVLHDLRQHLEEGKPFHGEALNYHKNQTTFFVEWNITPIRNSAEEITHFVAIQRNINDRKRLEVEREQLLAQERSVRSSAEVASRAKDEFLATLSHELRTPLTPIIGWAKVLRTKKLPQARFNEALEMIETNAKRQAQLVDDLLDLSQIVQGKLSLNLTDVTLTEPITAALATVRLAAEAKAIQIEVELDPTLHVRGDGGRLQQVVWNLLSNAIKFTPNNGRIFIRSCRSDNTALITVRDTGRGIDPHFLPFVFDRFRQQDSSITRQFGGLGLGLSLCRQLIEAHGGTITATSQGEDQGAQFTVRLPAIASTKAVAPVPSAAGELRLRDIRVLVVEDELSTLRFMTFLLEQEGAIVTATDSAAVALAAVKQKRFGVLISDIGMQEMDGYTLLRQIRTLSHQQNRDIPAIALTAYASESHRQETLAAGYQQHLAKPIDPDALIQAIVAVLVKTSDGDGRVAG